MAELSRRTDLTLPAFGYGAAGVGNLHRVVTDDDAHAVLEAAWDAGVRYFDTAPHYGLGLSERRLGAFLRTKPRDEFVLSTKAGRLLVPNPGGEDKLDVENFYHVPTVVKRQWDFSADGVRRSVHESLERLGLASIDLVYLHDPEQSDDLERNLASGAAALAALKDEGVIRASGLGSMDAGALALGADSGALDVLMVAGRLTLLEQPALADTVPECERTGTGIVTASVFNSGLLASDRPADNPRYDYGDAPQELLDRATRIADVCRAHAVPLPAAALQYTTRIAPVRSVVSGTSRAAQIRQNVEWMALEIPESLWADLASEQLLP